MYLQKFHWQYIYKRVFFSKKNIKFFIYVQTLEIFKWECIYKNVQCVYVSCNHYMLTSFFCKKKMIDFLCVILFNIFVKKKILRNNFICSYLSVRSRPWLDSDKRDSNGFFIFFLKKWGWDHKRIKRVSK